MSAISKAAADIMALALAGAYSREHLMLLLDQFADKLDGRAQAELFVDLMARHADISRQLEKTVAVLERTDAQRRDAQRVAMLGDWQADRATGALVWSDTMYDILELALSTQLGLAQFLDRVHPDDRHYVDHMAQQLMAGIAMQDLQYRLLMPDGRIKWVRTKHVSSATRGEPNMLYGTLQDVTKDKLTELELKKYGTHLEELVQEKGKEVFAAQMATIYALVKLAESRDDETGGHIERMSRYAAFAAQKLMDDGLYTPQVDEAFVRDIAMASPLHDIGKVGIPDGILLKPGRLTPDEFAIMKTHVTIGYQTLASVVQSYPGNAYLRMGMDIARYHHEKWDGSGYQDGLAGEAIPLAARILTLCDVYDALRSRRVYKEPYSHERSVGIIVEGKGKHFDPVLVALFERNQATFADIYRDAQAT